MCGSTFRGIECPGHSSQLLVPANLSHILVLSSKQPLLSAGETLGRAEHPVTWAQRPLFAILVLLLLALGISSCGGAVSNLRILQSITVTPAKADAPSSGKVQFRAKGNYNLAPMTVDPLPDVVWTVGRSDFSEAPVPNIATVDQNGLAKCVPGASGTIPIFANAAKDPTQPYQINNFRGDSAELTCP